MMLQYLKPEIKLKTTEIGTKAGRVSKNKCKSPQRELLTSKMRTALGENSLGMRPSVLCSRGKNEVKIPTTVPLGPGEVN